VGVLGGANGRLSRETGARQAAPVTAEDRTEAILQRRCQQPEPVTRFADRLIEEALTRTVASTSCSTNQRNALIVRR